MPAPHFDWQQGSYEEWVEKLHQWLGRCDPAYKKANEACLILSTLPELWLKGIITTRVAKGTQHQRTTPPLKELWDFLEHRCHEYDPTRADERLRALLPRFVEGQVSLLDSKDLYTCSQRLLPLSNQTGPHVICEQLLTKLSCIKEGVVEKEAKISQDSCVVDFRGLDPLPRRATFKNELRRYGAQHRTTVLKILSYAARGLVGDCENPYLMAQVLNLNNSVHENGYTMK